MAVVSDELTGLAVNANVIVDPNGSLLTLTGAGQVPVATSPLAPTVVYSAATGTQSNSNSGVTFNVDHVESIAIDITVSALNGGVLPNITFFLQRQGASGVWYTIWSNTSPLGAAGTISANIGQGYSGGTASTGNGGFSAVLVGTCQFGWSTGGTSAPTSWTGSAQVTTR